jgi:UDP-3-O-[3-hydroxymyristoyl] glucosamine N-acyltransferase
VAPLHAPVFRASLGDIAAHLSAELGAELIGDPAVVVTRIGPLESATPTTISFLSNPRYQAQLAGSQAACVIVGLAQRAVAAERGPALIAEDPYLCFARLTQWWAQQTRVPAAAGIHPSAVLAPSAQVAASASIGPMVVIEEHAVIAEGAVIGAHSFIGAGASVGRATRLAPRVTLHADCHIGAHSLVHSGAVIGADGFGFAPTQGRFEKIEQLGGVRIGDQVEIGANTCIDRGALEDTVVEDGAKLDNLIQIAHNVRIGAHAALAGCVGVAGSTHIGAGCTIGGAAMILGHLKLAPGVHISAASVVSRSLSEPGQYTGFFPIDHNPQWEKNAVIVRNLSALRERVRLLEKTIKTP